MRSSSTHWHTTQLLVSHEKIETTVTYCLIILQLSLHRTTRSMTKKRPSCRGGLAHFRCQLLPVDPWQTILREIVQRRGHNFGKYSYFLIHKLADNLQRESVQSVIGSFRTDPSVVFSRTLSPVSQDSHSSSLFIESSPFSSHHRVISKLVDVPTDSPEEEWQIQVQFTHVRNDGDTSNAPHEFVHVALEWFA